MLVLTVIQVFRKTNNRIYGYKLQDDKGNIKDITSEQLKQALKNNKVKLLNYKLTNDNRIIPIKNKEVYTNTNYILMNKNIKILKFDIDFGMIIQKYSNILPYNFSNITEWIDSRAKFSCARDVKEFFKSIGIENSKDYIEVTHCISLHDTFWIKREDDNLTWDNVSPFRHNYSNVISTYALEGINIGNKDKNYFSPVASTEGSFPHTWKYKGVDNVIFIKAGSKYTLGGSNSGREPYSEYFASQIAQYLKFNCVKYSIRKHIRHDSRPDVVTECKCFTTEQFGSVTAHKLRLNSYEEVIEYCKKLSDNAYNTCIDMFFLDCLLMNTDRHFSNIEFLVDNNTLRVIDITPIFDNNYALLPRFIEGYDTFNRSDYIARDGRTFEELYQLVKKHKTYQKELINLKKYKITRPNNKDVDISDLRLRFLNDFLQMQVNYLLNS